MQILLVDLKTGLPSREKNFVPLALRKLYTYYTKQGHSVEYIQSDAMPKDEPDIMCFSPIFLFKFQGDIDRITAFRKLFPSALARIGGISVSLKKDMFEQKLGNRNIEYIVGLNEEIEVCHPEYDVIPSSFSYGFTSRGCVNRCAWCVVPKIEGAIRPLKGWENQLGSKHRRFFLMDNNLLACEIDHIESVLDAMSEHGKLIDFNQGLDCILFTKKKEELVPIFEKYRDNIPQVRFSWDSKKQDKYILPTIEILNSLKKQGVWYLLYGFNEDIEEVHHRITVLLQNKQAIKLMRFKDINTGKENVLEWHDKLANYISYRFIAGIVSPRRTDSGILFPTDFNKFKKMLNIFESYILSMPASTRENADRDTLFKMRDMLEAETGEPYFQPYVAPEPIKIDYEDSWF